MQDEKNLLKIPLHSYTPYKHLLHSENTKEEKPAWINMRHDDIPKILLKKIFACHRDFWHHKISKVK